MFGKTNRIVAIVVAAVLCSFLSSVCSAQTYTSNDGCLTANATGGLNKVPAACIYGQVKITKGLPQGYCYFNASGFSFGGNALSMNFYLDKNLNLHTEIVTLGRYAGKFLAIAYGYITITNYLDPTKPDSFGALIEGYAAPYVNKALYSTGWTDENGNGPDSTDFVVEWPILGGYANPVPVSKPTQSL